METIKANQILIPRSGGDEWFGANYGMNLYKGCSHGCIYCDSRSDCYRIDRFDEVRGKENALAILERELAVKRRKGIVATGAMSDPYNPREEEHKLTRGALELLHHYGFGAVVQTKSDLVVRDIDILARISEKAPLSVEFTVTTFADDLCRKLEPSVAPSSRRLQALREVSRAGIFTGVHIWPVLPFITDSEDNVAAIVRSAAVNGARFVFAYCGVTLRQNQRDYFYRQLDRIFPGLKEKYRHTFGGRYECIPPNSEALQRRLQVECTHSGQLFSMRDVREAIRQQHRARQLRLF